MNIFILDENHDKCAEYHVDKHIVKMPLEAAQMLCTNHWIDKYLGFVPRKLDKEELAVIREQKKMSQETSPTSRLWRTILALYGLGLALAIMNGFFAMHWPSTKNTDIDTANRIRACMKSYSDYQRFYTYEEMDQLLLLKLCQMDLKEKTQ